MPLFIKLQCKIIDLGEGWGVSEVNITAIRTLTMFRLFSSDILGGNV